MRPPATTDHELEAVYRTLRQTSTTVTGVVLRRELRARFGRDAGTARVYGFIAEKKRLEAIGARDQRIAELEAECMELRSQRAESDASRAKQATVSLQAGEGSAAATTDDYTRQLAEKDAVLTQLRQELQDARQRIRLVEERYDADQSRAMVEIDSLRQQLRSRFG